MTEDQPQSDSLELREYFRILWVRKWTLLFVVVVVVSGVLFLSYRQKPVYLSKVKALAPAPASSVSETGQIVYGKSSLEDEAQVATSEPVAAKVIESLNLKTTPAQLIRSVSVAPFKNAQTVLLFEATSGSPQQAAAIAHEFAVQYMAYRGEQNAAILQAQLDSVRSELAATVHRLKRTDPHREPDTFGSLTTSKTQLSQRRDLFEAAVANVKESSGDILTDAQIPGGPIRPNHVRDALLALLVGLILGAGAAFVRDYMDDSLRGGEDVERQSGASLVGAIPHMSMPKRAEGDRPYLVAIDDPKAMATEAYRTLRTNLMFMAATQKLRRIVITSPRQGEGKSTTAANLASVMAQAGERVLLADADLRRPASHQFFGLSNRVGLSSVLSGQAVLEEAVQNPGIPGLRVIGGGPVPPNPVELLGSAVMRAFLDQVAEVTDWLILDGPPVLGLADASVLSSLSDGVLFVVNDTTSRRVLAHARDQLEKVHADVIGTVLNNFGSSHQHYYSQYYAYSSEYVEGGVSPAPEPSRRSAHKRSRKEQRAEKRAQRVAADAEARAAREAAKAEAARRAAAIAEAEPNGAAEPQPPAEEEESQAASQSGPDEFFLSS